MLSSIKKALAAALLVTSTTGIATVAEAKTEIVFLRQAPSLQLAVEYGRHFEIAKVVDTSTGKTVAEVKIADRPVPIQVMPAAAQPVFHTLPYHGTYEGPVHHPIDLGSLRIKIDERRLEEQSRSRWMTEHRSERDLECGKRGDKLTCQVVWETKHHDDFKNWK